MHIDDIRERAIALNASAEAIRAIGRDFDDFLPVSARKEMPIGTSLQVKEDGSIFGEIFSFPFIARRTLIAEEGMFSGLEYRWHTKSGDDEVLLLTTYLWHDGGKITLDADRRKPLIDANHFFVALYLIGALVEALLHSEVVRATPVAVHLSLISPSPK